MANDDVQVWRYVVKPEDPWRAWGIFLLDSSGMFTVVSDNGNYAYKWSDWGPGDFREFLAGLDLSYLCTKLAAGRNEYQGQATLSNIREDICQRRREKGLTQKKARHEWNLAEQVDTSHGESFAAWLSETELGSDSYEYGVYDLPQRLRFFYDRVFMRLVGILKQELDKNDTELTN